MRTVLVTQYYPPETGAPPNRLHSLALGLKKAGHDVTVIAPKPNHPEGIIWSGYRKGFVRVSRTDGITVLHCSVYTSRKKTFVSRLAFYLSFVIVSILVGTCAHSRWDVVIGSSPPLFVGISALVIARFKRSRFFFDVRDLWPDVAIALGVLRNPLLITLSRRLERFLYKSADGISGVTDGVCNHIRETVGGSPPVRRVRNGTVSEIFAGVGVSSDVHTRIGADNHFVALFAGNLGLAHGLDHVIDAASKLKAAHSDVLFVFLGSGPVKEHLMEEVSRRGLQSVRFLPRTTLESAAVHMAAADVLLCPVFNHPISLGYIPAKFFDSMAAGRPVLLAVDGEARAILEAADAGIYYPAEDAEGLVKAVLRLKADPVAADRMGRNGRAFAAAHCSREEQACIMTRFIEEIVRQRKEKT